MDEKEKLFLAVRRRVRERIKQRDDAARLLAKAAAALGTGKRRRRRPKSKPDNDE
ncbi:MAG: hypothetical protein JSR78_14190 [Proteobacteria bacterium]|nr:hypothetical protein [Pseudomonadota bacterium]